MSLRIASRFAARELRGGLRGFRILLACLALGVAAIAGVGTVKSSIEAGLRAQGASMLGGQAEAEFTYRFATDEERAWLQSQSTALSEVTDFRSMAVADGPNGPERGLTQVKSVDDAYPLVGAVELDSGMSLAQALDGRDGIAGAVMQRILADRIGLKVGDRFKLGTGEFILMDLIKFEPDSAGDGFGLGPRTIVRTRDLDGSGLLAAGSLYSTKYRVLLPAGADLDAMAATAKDQFEHSGMRWRDARNGAPGVATFVERLGAFLVLVGLAGLAVGGVGVSSAVNTYLEGKTSVIATLRTLGATRGVIFATYMIQIGVLSGIGIVLGLILGAGVPLMLAPILSANLPVPTEFAIYPAPLVEAAIYGALTAAVFALWPLSRTENIRAAALFRDAFSAGGALPRWPYVLGVGILLGALVAIAIWFNGNATLTLWIAVGIAGALLSLALAAWGIRRAARRMGRYARGPVSRWALSAIGGPREGAVSVVLALGLGLSVLAAVGQIDGNLRAAISRDLPEVAPSYFFVDIQPDQIDGFVDRLAKDPQVSRTDTAPMMRGIVSKINGVDATTVAGEHWVIRGDRGITFADAMPQNTKLVAGQWWTPDDTRPQVSFAREEAEEIGLTLGDVLTVNILGRDIDVTITSLREVDFSTAGIGFVMTLNRAAVAGAPHSYIATVYAEEQAEAQILRDLAGMYPNITAIRVRDAIDQVSKLLAAIAAATSYGAAATVFTGFIVLIGAAAAGERARTFEAAVLKTIGATRGQILRSFALRSAMMGAAAGSVALGVGIAGGYGVSKFLLETEYAVVWPSAIAIILGGIGANMIAGLAFAWRPLGAKPARVLRSAD